MRRLAQLAAACLLLLGTARAAEAPAGEPPTAQVVVRAGDHRGFGRIVYEFAGPAPVALSTPPGRVRIEAQGVPVLPTPERLPRNVLSVRPAGAAIEYDLAPGAQARVARLGSRVVVDLLDPPRSPAAPGPRPHADRAAPSTPALATSPATPATAPPSPEPVSAAATPGVSPSLPSAALPPQPTLQAGPAPAPTPILPTASAPATVPAPGPAPASATAPTPASGAERPATTAPREVAERQPSPPSVPLSPAPSSPMPPPPAPVAEDGGPISVAAAPLPPGEAGAFLPFPERVGAAAFRRGGRALLVFDARQPLDMAQLKDDPVLGAAKVELLPAATLVSFPFAPDARLRLEHAREGWRVRLGAAAAPPAPPVQQKDGEVAFGLGDPSQVVVVPDPETQVALLVGTVRPTSGSGNAVGAPRRTPSFRVVPTWLGLAVEPLSDRVQLTARTDGFALRVPGGLLAPEVTADAALADSAALTRSFDFPDLPTAALLRRMETSVAAAAAAPPRGRLPARLVAAQAMIALGLGAEAHGLLAAARAEEPRSDQDGQVAVLQAIAALLDGHPERAGALGDPRLAGSDEVALWRAVAAASQAALKDEPSPAAAATFAATSPLILAYPQPLRDKLLPLAAETLALGGQEKAADALVAKRPDDAALTFARALLLEAGGEADQALALYDQLSTDRDRLVRVRAGVRAAELRRRGGQLTAAATADALDRLIVVWRGDQRELALRLRVAELRAEAGQFRPALELLRDTRTMFPAAREAIKARMGRVIEALLSGDRAGTLRPLDFVTLAAEFADSVPDGEAGDRLAELMASRLDALDLPDQAAPILQRLVRGSPAGSPRARFGLHLAATRLESGNAPAALAALQESDGPDLSHALREERDLVRARAQARQGDLPGAVATLSALGTERADELRAGLLEGAKDWPGALAALRDLAAKRVAAAGPLPPEQQDIVVREASAALQAGDGRTLASLREGVGARMGTGPRADLFRLLTGRPVQAPSDLPRAARDLVLARGMSQDLRSLSAP